MKCDLLRGYRYYHMHQSVAANNQINSEIIGYFLSSAGPCHLLQ